MRGVTSTGAALLVALAPPVIRPATNGVSDPSEVSTTRTAPERSSRPVSLNAPVLPTVVEPSWLHAVAPRRANSSTTVWPASEAGAAPRTTTSRPYWIWRDCVWI